MANGGIVCERDRMMSRMCIGIEEQKYHWHSYNIVYAALKMVWKETTETETEQKKEEKLNFNGPNCWIYRPLNDTGNMISYLL